MANNKKVRMPASIRNKLVAALCMLLVSTIMLVSATFAWFTLSTAPEVTGITTSVGANGNLEIALLTTDTYAAPASITSGVGDSSDVQGAVAANVTWGNLVDLSDPSYGLTDIKLNQSVANISEGVLNVGNPLKTAEYGKDGRVANADALLISAVKDETTGAFTYEGAEDQTYGVRAVGQASDLTPRQMAFNGAKSAVTANQSKAVSSTKNAIAGAGTTFYALALAGSSPTSYTYAQVEALRDIANGLKKSLDSVVLTYANAGLVAAAADGSAATDEQVEAIRTALGTTSDADALKTLLNAAGVTSFNSKLDALASAQTSVSGVLTNISAMLADNTDKENFTAETEYHGSAGDAAYINTQLVALVGEGTSAYDAYDADDQLVTGDASQIMSSAKKVYMKAGALGTLTTYTGNFEIADMMGIKVYAGAQDAAADWPNIASYEAPEGADVVNISDSFGFILDFAFRTNAADSTLQLQTEAANRVYSSGETGTATEGAGSTATFTYGADTTVEQATTLLENVKFVFFDPAAGTVYAEGKLDNIDAASGSATAEIVLDKTDPAEGEEDDIVALQQNEIKFVSVLVYLDGTDLTNADVANAQDSGTLDLNLQFSSSTALVPMENTALRNLEA